MRVRPKVGLFLDSKPSGGGSFQYCQAIVEATANIAGESCDIVVRYSHDAWVAELGNYPQFDAAPLRSMTLGKYMGKVFRQLGVGMAAWRRIADFVDPVVRTIQNQEAVLWIFPSQDAWAYQIPVPSLVPIHDLMHRYERSFPEVGSHGTFRRRESHYRWLCRWARGILVDSEVGRNQVIESYNCPADRIHVLPFIAPPYVYNESTLVNIRAKYELLDKYLFYPAQFWYHKNHLRLIEAVASVLPELPDLSLVVVGAKKNAYDEAVKRVKLLGLRQSVRFLGYVPVQDVVSLYQHARAMIMPTLCGPTNIPTLEAFVLGCPAAVSRIYGMPEQVGDAALLFDPTSVDDIATAIRRLWTDDGLCGFLADKGRKRAAAWGPRQFSKRLEGILRKVLEER